MKKIKAIEIMNDILRHLSMNPNELACALGKKRAQAIYDILDIKKDNVGISKKFAQQIIDIFPDFNLYWLLTGEGSMLREQYGNNSNSIVIGDGVSGNSNIIGNFKGNISNNTTPREKQIEAPVANFTSGVPYYNVDFIAGFDVVLNDQTINPEYLIAFQKYDSADYWCNVTGHSMEPEIANGDIIAIKEVKNWLDFMPYGEIYGIVTDDFRTIKKVTGVADNDDYLLLIPTNTSPEYQPQKISKKIIRGVFHVLGCMKKL